MAYVKNLCRALSIVVLYTAFFVNSAQVSRAQDTPDIIQALNEEDANNEVQGTSEAPERVLVYDGNAAKDFLNSSSAQKRPQSLSEVISLERDVELIDDTALAFDIRSDAIREGAISYGARAGLAWRTFEISSELQRSAKYLDEIYNFRSLLIPAPSGFLIEPPVVTESMNAVIVSNDGLQAAVSDRIYNIVNNAKIVSTARTWRTYLEREWSDAIPPPDILRPEDEDERELWKELVIRGWSEGVKQANEIFESDLNLLTRDFRGMVRYRALLAQNMISAPYALQVDRGVTGGGDEMRIGDRAVQMTGVPKLITGSKEWQPANR